MYNVLIIDDDKLERKGLISIVSWEECGMRVVGDVANGMLALEFLKKEHVDLAVVDVSMPVLSGLDFIRESRARYPDLQYVVLSFHEDFEYVQSALRLGALDYISKLRMEEMDCTDVFRRVGKLLKASMEKPQASSAPAEGPGSEGLSRALLEELRTAWCDCRWLFDRERFGRLRQELAESSISSRQMERLLMWVSQQIESEYGFSCPVPFFSVKAEGIGWLENRSRSLYEMAAGSDDLTRIPVCILRAAGYIRAHITEKLKAENVAGQVNMSRGYFSVNFKSVTGYTFNDFVRNERIELAKRLLREGGARPGNLAEAVGYEDRKYFARVFLEQTGVNCSEYAKQFAPAPEEKGKNVRKPAENRTRQSD